LITILPRCFLMLRKLAVGSSVRSEPTLQARTGGSVCRHLALLIRPPLSARASPVGLHTTARSLPSLLMHTPIAAAAATPALLARGPSARPVLSRLLGSTRGMVGFNWERVNTIRGKGKSRTKPNLRGTKHQALQKYKLKSHHGALKRFFQLETPEVYKGMVLPKGTFMHKQAGKSHLMAGSSRRRGTARKQGYKPVLTKGYHKRLKKLMPYGTVRERPPRYKQPLFWERTETFAIGVAATKRAPHVLPRDGGLAMADKAKSSRKAELLRKAQAGWPYDRLAFDSNGYLIELEKRVSVSAPP